MITDDRDVLLSSDLNAGSFSEAAGELVRVQGRDGGLLALALNDGRGDAFAGGLLPDGRFVDRRTLDRRYGALQLLLLDGL